MERWDPMKGRVLVVDDDAALAEMLGIVLRGEGFEPTFVADGDKAVAAFRDFRPDLVLLDLMLPGSDGIDVCRQIRAESGVPIVMLTAKTDTVDVVLGLESGADDYIVKPFKSKELVARVRARLRRTDEPAPEMLQIGDIVIDVAGHSVKRDGETLNLTPLEFDLLVALARKPRQVFTREVLLEQVWGYRHAADTRLVNVHVQRLRAKIEKDPEHPEIVVTGGCLRRSSTACSPGAAGSAGSSRNYAAAGIARCNCGWSRPRWYCPLWSSPCSASSWSSRSPRACSAARSSPTVTRCRTAPAMR